MPCYSSNGGMLAKRELNFPKSTDYSVYKQKKEAAKMYVESKKDATSQKDARETNPDFMRTKEQIEIIKSCADSL
jgi:hypothetical protein